jgi:fructosamine-3-kinase
MWDSEIGGTLDGELEPAHVAAFVKQHCAVDVERVLLDVQPLLGGLESRAVARVQAEARVCRGSPRSFTFVVKRLDGPAHRELAMYDLLSAAGTRAIPQRVGVQAVGPATSYLFLEWIPAARWPWAEPALVSHVLEQLADLHGRLSGATSGSSLGAWDYEAELLPTAEATLKTLEVAVQTSALAGLRRLAPALRRVVAELPGMRRQLLSSSPLGQSMLHGDVHSGNVLIREVTGTRSAVLLDWARARPGSPLEDVSSWLESLGYWEPLVRQQRSRLLQHYLRARGLPAGATREIYVWYWVAAASNALAGALKYHLQQAMHLAESAPGRQVDAVRAARDYLHAIERADFLWRCAAGPQMVMIIKGAHVAASVSPVHDGEAGIGGSEGFPACSADTVERAEDLAYDTRVGDNDDPLASMIGGDGAYGPQDTPTEIAVALAARPAEAVVDLPQIGPPQDRITLFHFGDGDALEATTVDLPQ